MGHHRCLDCNLMTGIPESHPTCNGIPTRWEICTCGSGSHPRRCALHPGAFNAHIAELNAESRADEQRETAARILAAWLTMPSMRLGNFIQAAAVEWTDQTDAKDTAGGAVSGIDDDDLADACERFAEMERQPGPATRASAPAGQP